MLVTIYEVDGIDKANIRVQGRYCSLDMTTDYRYWLGAAHDVRMRVWSEKIPLPDALGWLNGDDRVAPDGKRGLRPPQNRSNQTESCAGWRIVTTADMRASLEEWMEPCQSTDKRGQALEHDWDLDEPILHDLKRQLAGRRLLLEEVQRLCIHMGWIKGDANDRLHRIIQWMVLRGDVKLLPGMAAGVGERPGERAGNRWVNGWARIFRKFRAARSGRELRCGRCDSGPDQHHVTLCAVCGRLCPYCEACLTMGRVRSCSIFIVTNDDASSDEAARAGSSYERQAGTEADRSNVQTDVQSSRKARAVDGRKRRLDDGSVSGNESEDNPKRKVSEEYMNRLLKRWNLSRPQEDASRKALEFVAAPVLRDTKEGERFLIWAVTGAGKTEMVYPLVEYMLNKGGRVLLTAPRRDVVLELAPRLAKAFADYRVVALYGGSEQRWEIGDITVSTTHQLLRLERCFDLVVLDELDAYPYHHNPMLAFAVRRACKPRGKIVMLTATPPREQQIALRRKDLPHAIVPVRYHRHPLPVPRLLKYRGIPEMLSAGRPPRKLQAALESSLKRGAQVFVFVPRIEHVEPLTRLLRRALADAVAPSSIDGTSSRDTDRTNRVLRFRSRDIRVLVTTTILERGVTIPQSDVFVLDADADLFDEAALVQMAGRAGRSSDDPDGRVFFAARMRTEGLVRAIRHIRSMNALAQKRGLLAAQSASVRQGGEAHDDG